jgi:hypothetical protein
LTVELCALLHDVADWKYSGCDKAGVSTVNTFLTDQRAGTALQLSKRRRDVLLRWQMGQTQLVLPNQSVLMTQLSRKM